MNNPMDSLGFNNTLNIQQQYQNAMRNPQAFVEQMARNNPQAYQRAMEISRLRNPREAVMQMLASRGLSPAMFNLPVSM